MLTCMDFEREVTPRIETAPAVFTTVKLIKKSNAYSPWIELLHFKLNISSASSVKDSTLEIEETSSILDFLMLCELSAPNPYHSI